MLETLICTADENAPHEFTRTRKRGVKPSTCPDCKAVQVEARQAEVAARAEAEHLIGGIITVAAVRAIQGFRDWLKEDAYLFSALKSGEINRSEWIVLRTPCPDINGGDFPSSDTWRMAENAGLI